MLLGGRDISATVLDGLMLEDADEQPGEYDASGTEGVEVIVGDEVSRVPSGRLS